jgi:hypothetical protein
LLRTCVMLGLALLVAAAAQAAVLVEAENYVASYNTGGIGIQIVACSGASGGYAVEGVDVPGEWIEIPVTVPEIYGYADTLRSAGETGVESDLEMRIVSAFPGGGDVISTYHTVGLGIT